MKTPPSRQAHLEFAERLVSGILQPVFRVSNARLRSRNELHAHLLALDRVAWAERRNTARRPESRHRGKRRRERETRMNSNAQSALIVSGKSQKQKQR